MYWKKWVNLPNMCVNVWKRDGEYWAKRRCKEMRTWGLEDIQKTKQTIDGRRKFIHLQCVDRRMPYFHHSHGLEKCYFIFLLYIFAEMFFFIPMFFFYFLFIFSLNFVSRGLCFVIVLYYLVLVAIQIVAMCVSWDILCYLSAILFPHKTNRVRIYLRAG